MRDCEWFLPMTDFDFFPFATNLRTMEMSRVLQAKDRARKADLAIVVVGENSMRYMWKDKTCGENVDRYELSLVGLQQQLVEEIYATGVPTIVVLVNGRPLSTEWIAENIPALVEAWEPGSFGGQAVAEILYGKVNPEAKLPITIPVLPVRFRLIITTSKRANGSRTVREKVLICLSLDMD